MRRNLPSRSLALYLGDLEDAADSIFRFVHEIDKAQFLQNDLIQAAVERKFEIIGEALRQMRQHYPAAMHEIEDAGKIIAFRHVIAHDYSTVDLDDVWSAILSKLPAFREQVARFRKINNA